MKYTTILLPADGDDHGVTGRCSTMTVEADTPSLAAERRFAAANGRTCLVVEHGPTGRATFTSAFRAEAPSRPRFIAVPA